jgi:hypothetical protein
MTRLPNSKLNRQPLKFTEGGVDASEAEADGRALGRAGAVTAATEGSQGANDYTVEELAAARQALQNMSGAKPPRRPRRAGGCADPGPLPEEDPSTMTTTALDRASPEAQAIRQRWRNLSAGDWGYRPPRTGTATAPPRGSEPPRPCWLPSMPEPPTPRPWPLAGPHFWRHRPNEHDRALLPGPRPPLRGVVRRTDPLVAAGSPGAPVLLRPLPMASAQAPPA